MIRDLQISVFLTLTLNNWSTSYSNMALIGETEVACLFEVRTQL